MQHTDTQHSNEPKLPALPSSAASRPEFLGSLTESASTDAPVTPETPEQPDTIPSTPFTKPKSEPSPTHNPDDDPDLPTCEREESETGLISRRAALQTLTGLSGMTFSFGASSRASAQQVQLVQPGEAWTSLSVEEQFAARAAKINDRIPLPDPALDELMETQLCQYLWDKDAKIIANRNAADFPDPAGRKPSGSVISQVIGMNRDLLLGARLDLLEETSPSYVTHIHFSALLGRYDSAAEIPDLRMGGRINTYQLEEHKPWLADFTLGRSPFRGTHDAIDYDLHRGVGPGMRSVRAPIPFGTVRDERNKEREVYDFFFELERPIELPGGYVYLISLYQNAGGDFLTPQFLGSKNYIDHELGFHDDTYVAINNKDLRFDHLTQPLRRYDQRGEHVIEAITMNFYGQPGTRPGSSGESSVENSLIY